MAHYFVIATRYKYGRQGETYNDDSATDGGGGGGGFTFGGVTVGVSGESNGFVFYLYL